jgi:hypothetical protein
MSVLAKLLILAVRGYSTWTDLADFGEIGLKTTKGVHTRSQPWKGGTTDRQAALAIFNWCNDKDEALSMFVNTDIVAPQHQQQRSNTTVDDALLFLAATEHAYLKLFHYQYHGLH